MQIIPALRFRLPMLQSALSVVATAFAPKQESYQETFRRVSENTEGFKNEVSPIPHTWAGKSALVAGTITIAGRTGPAAFSMPHTFAPGIYPIEAGYPIPPELAIHATEQGMIKIGAYVFEMSLASLKKSFPHSDLHVVYVPSPLLSYPIADQRPPKIDHGANQLVQPSELYEISDFMCRQIEAATEKLGGKFLDSRTDIRAAGSRVALHGPRDWTHFGKEGNIALGNIVARFLTQAGTSTPCAELASSAYSKRE